MAVKDETVEEPKSPRDVVATQDGAPVPKPSCRIFPSVEEVILAKVLAELA